MRINDTKRKTLRTLIKGIKLAALRHNPKDMQRVCQTAWHCELAINVIDADLKHAAQFIRVVDVEIDDVVWVRDFAKS